MKQKYTQLKVCRGLVGKTEGRDRVASVALVNDSLGVLKHGEVVHADAALLGFSSDSVELGLNPFLHGRVLGQVVECLFQSLRNSFLPGQENVGQRVVEICLCRKPKETAWSSGNSGLLLVKVNQVWSLLRRFKAALSLRLQFSRVSETAHLIRIRHHCTHDASRFQTPNVVENGEGQSILHRDQQQRPEHLLPHVLDALEQFLHFGQSKIVLGPGRNLPDDVECERVEKVLDVQGERLQVGNIAHKLMNCGLSELLYFLLVGGKVLDEELPLFSCSNSTGVCNS